jgi:hypothetical protein
MNTNHNIITHIAYLATVLDGYDPWHDIVREDGDSQ